MAPLPFRLKLRPISCSSSAQPRSVGFQGLDECSFKTHLGMVCARRTRLVAATATVATLATAVATIAARLVGLRVGHGARRLLARKQSHLTQAPSLAVACCVECAFSVIGALLPGVTEEYALGMLKFWPKRAWAGALLGVTQGPE